MKKRDRIKASKVISISATGNIISCSRFVPTKNVIIAKASKNVSREAYNPEDREKYKQFSKSIANKVKEFRTLKEKLNRLEPLVNKQGLSNLDKSFDKILSRCDAKDKDD